MFGLEGFTDKLLPFALDTGLPFPAPISKCCHFLPLN